MAGNSFRWVERRIEEQDVVGGKDKLALRDLMLIDAALAEIAQAIGLSVTDRDTVSVDLQRKMREY